jgi:agmatinase
MTFEAYVQGFGCLPQPVAYADASAVVVPVPLEWGGEEGLGYALGPLAVLGASRFVETHDAELGIDALSRGVATVDAVRLSYESPEKPFRQIWDRVAAVLDDPPGATGGRKLPLCIGGERTLGLAAAGACRAAIGDLGVVLIARRPGFCNERDGRRVSPSTIGRRLAESFPCCVLGPRSWNAEEAAFMASPKAPRVVSARRLERSPTDFGDACDKLPRSVYLSIDVGALDGAYMPVPGNIEPGGLSWFALTDAIREVFRRFEVVGCDVSGFAPIIGHAAPSLLVAQLVVRCLGLAFLARSGERAER